MKRDFTPININEIRTKMEYYCAYQERCHIEVHEKLRSFQVNSNEMDEIMVHLIQNNYLNEERFACVFAISKFHQKKWGKIRIKNELKARKINKTLITSALKEITHEEYDETFNTLAEKHWNSISETNSLKKRKKFCDYILRRGFESNLVYDKMKELENKK